MRFSGSGADQVHVVTGAEINAGAENGLYWSPTVPGDALSVEIEVPTDAGAAKIDIELLRVAHYSGCRSLRTGRRTPPAGLSLPAIQPGTGRAARRRCSSIQPRTERRASARERW